MLHALLKRPLMALLRAPTEPPETPAGSHASVQVFRASPRFLTYRLLLLRLFTAGAVVTLVSLVLLGLMKNEGAPLAAAALLLLLVFPILLVAGFVVRIDYELRYYVVTDRSLRVREGAWTVKEMTITYANVQNLRVVQGPLMRLFGIWDLRVDVAGGGARHKQSPHEEGGHHVNVAGIENAHEVRDLVLTHLRAARAGSGLGDLDEGQAQRTPPSGLSPAGLAALERVAAAAAALASTARGAAGESPG